MSGFLFVHSPLVGPLTWKPVAELVGERVPDLRGFVAAAPPRSEAFVDLAIAAAATRTDLVLVGHSGAGAFLPSIAAGLSQPPRALVFVDAVVPPAVGAHSTPAEFRAFLAGLTDGAVLPRWSSWWDPDAMAAAVPLAEQRAALSGQEGEVPLSFFDEPVAVPSGWTATPHGFVRLSAAYDAEVELLTEQSRPVRVLDLSHLAMVTHPAEVLAAIEAVLAELVPGDR